MLCIIQLLLCMMRYVSFNIEMYGLCLLGVCVCGCRVVGVHSLVDMLCCCIGVSINWLCVSCVSCVCGCVWGGWWCPRIVDGGGCGLGVCRFGVLEGGGVAAFGLSLARVLLSSAL